MNSWIMSLKLKIKGLLSVYAPQVGCQLKEREEFWSKLDEECPQGGESGDWSRR